MLLLLQSWQQLFITASQPSGPVCCGCLPAHFLNMHAGNPFPLRPSF